MKKILFISHEASLTGAPILLLNFIKWFKDNSDHPFVILIRKDGPLKTDFEKLGPVVIYKDYFKVKSDIKTRLLNRVFGTLKQPADQLRKDFIRHNIGLIFSNTITNGDIIKNLGLPNVKMITYVHELSFVIENLLGVKENLDIVLSKTSFFLTGSEAVRQNLILSYGVTPEKSKVVYSYLPALDFKKKSEMNGVKTSGDLGIPEDAYIVGGIGKGLWRKGIDLFLNVADILINKLQKKDIYFLWIGMDEGDELNMIKYDAKRLDLLDRVMLVPPDKNIQRYLALFDILLLTSREDPFPVVVIEAASMEVPVICFEEAGGAPEFVANNCGFAVPFLNTEMMAEKVLHLKESPRLASLITKNAYKKVADYHDIKYAGPVIKKQIEEVMEGR